MVGRFLQVLAFAAVLSAPAHAATVSIALSDGHGGGASDAVVTLAPVSGTLATRAPDEAVIDQRNQMFMPLVVTIRRGGRVVFANHDNTMHQAYSFSTIKQFETEIDKGQRSKPIIFDTAGIAVIGCNIHDNMIAYVFVSDAPVAIVTDAKGEAKLGDIPPGSYHVSIWHPRLDPGAVPVGFDLTVAADGATIARALSLASDRGNAMHHQHMQSY